MNDTDAIVIAAAIAAIPSAFAVFVAWRSSELERTKVRLALFEQRYQCYQATLNLIKEAILKRDWPAETDVQFLDQWHRAKFIFPDKVALEMSLIRKKMRRDILTSCSY